MLYLKQKDQQHLEKEQPAPAVYYLIQRTALPNEALLVKGGKGNAEEEEEEVSIADKYSPARSLFGGMDKQYLPVGHRLSTWRRSSLFHTGTGKRSTLQRKKRS